MLKKYLDYLAGFTIVSGLVLGGMALEKNYQLLDKYFAYQSLPIKTSGESPTLEKRNLDDSRKSGISLMEVELDEVRVYQNNSDYLFQGVSGGTTYEAGVYAPKKGEEPLKKRAFLRIVPTKK